MLRFSFHAVFPPMQPLISSMQSYPCQARPIEALDPLPTRASHAYRIDYLVNMRQAIGR